MSSDQLSPLVADLHLLTVLAATKSFTEAARRLGVSKASASMRISELERSAGVSLVRRTTRSVGLTEAGQQLVNEMRRTHALCDEHEDVATASLLEVWIDEAERRTWFLFEASRSGELA